MKTIINQLRADGTKAILAILVSFSSLTINAQVFEWSKQFGGVTDPEGAWVVTTDQYGNVYIGGDFRETGDFDPGPGTYYMTALGGMDGFIVKLTAAGNFVWARSFGSTAAFPAGDMVKKIFVAPSGNIYVSGHFNETVDFDPGPGVFNLVSMTNTETGCSSKNDGFILKLNASGNFIWARGIGGSGQDGLSIHLGPSESIIVSGRYESISCSTDPVDLDPGAGTYYVPGGGGTYIEKLDSDGNLVWVDVFPGWTGCTSPCGGKTKDIGLGPIVADVSGNIYCAGTYSKQVDFDPGPGTHLLTPTASSSEVFVLKLTSAGNFVWAKPLGGTPGSYTFSQAMGIDVDASGNVFCNGFFKGKADFDPGTGKKILSSLNGSDDSFVWKLTSSGFYSWAVQMGSSDNDRSIAIDIGADDNVYTTGWFYGNADFDPGRKAYLLSNTSGTNADIYVSRLSNAGSFVWASRIQTDPGSYLFGSNIWTDASNNVYVTGWWEGIVDFDPGSGTYNMTNYGESAAHDAFVVKLNQAGPASRIITGDIISETSLDKIVLYPNPATNQITIQNNNHKILGTISIYDMSRKMIYKKFTGNSHTTIDVKSFSAGVYYIRSDHSGERPLKFVKQ